MQMCNDNETHLGYRGMRRRKVKGVNDILEGGKKGQIKMLNIRSACVNFNEDPTHLYLLHTKNHTTIKTSIVWRRNGRFS